VKRKETIRKLKYVPMTRKLLKAKNSFNNRLDKSKLTIDSTRQVHGLSMSVKGRLRGVRRSRKLELIEKGVSANTLAKEHKFIQVPISTK
tara:strand:- start:946 stop:1215 length:270 start_codon:yes stop_codon:yes gene_type:complete